MSEKKDIVAETEAYLAKIRKTVSASKNLVESARLRMAETDRLLESAGMTREEVKNLTFTAAQKAAVNEELERMGYEPLADGEERDVREEYGTRSLGEGAEEANVRPMASEAGANFTAGDGDGSVENRKRKFNVMMQRFRM